MPVISEGPLKLFQTAEESEKPERAEIIGNTYIVFSCI